MTWEIIAGLTALISGFIAVMNVVVRVNRTLTSLEIAVTRLEEFIRDQTQENDKLKSVLQSHDLRIAGLECTGGGRVESGRNQKGVFQ